MSSIHWADADFSPFDSANPDRDKIEKGHPVPCRLCEAVYRVLTLTMRWCATCGQGYCQPAHGAWVGRRGACIQCGPHQGSNYFLDGGGAESPEQDLAVVSYDVFLERLKGQFAAAPMQFGKHRIEIRNWTQDKGDLPDKIPVFWEPGHESFSWKTGLNNLRQFSSAEARQVYEVWNDYRAQRVTRNYITNTLGVQNSKPIIALFRTYERLMA
jgi:hypothetical protein